MAYKKVPSSHTEFGGADDGRMIDAERRKDRALLPHEQLWEVYATDPLDPNSTPETSDVDAMPRPYR